MPLSGRRAFVGISGNELKEIRDGGVQYLALQKACRELAERIRITLPDPTFNTLGGALAVAADGIKGVWLRGLSARVLSIIVASGAGGHGAMVVVEGWWW